MKSSQTNGSVNEWPARSPLLGLSQAQSTCHASRSQKKNKLQQKRL